MTEFGPKSLIDTGVMDENGAAIKLPGVRTGDYSLRVFKPEVRVSCVRFSPTGVFFNLLDGRIYITSFVVYLLKIIY